MEVHRSSAGVLAARQRGRRQVARRAPGYHHALPALCRGARRAEHHAFHDSSFHRYRERRGYHLGSEAGLRRAGRVRRLVQGPLATR